MNQQPALLLQPWDMQQAVNWQERCFCVRLGLPRTPAALPTMAPIGTEDPPELSASPASGPGASAATDAGANVAGAGAGAGTATGARTGTDTGAGTGAAATPHAAYASALQQVGRESANSYSQTK
jgi:hypothetical protein